MGITLGHSFQLQRLEAQGDFLPGLFCGLIKSVTREHLLRPQALAADQRMDVPGHFPLEITAGTLPAPGGSSRYLAEEEFPALEGVEMAIKNHLGRRTFDSKFVLPSHRANKVAGKGREPQT